MMVIGTKNGKTHCYQIDTTNCVIDGVQFSRGEFEEILKNLED